MTAEQWGLIRHFTSHEFDSPDLPGSGAEHMDMAFVMKLDYLRQRCGFPLRITSGYRTPQHNANAHVGGVDSSAHIAGKAADIQAESSTARFKILSEALRLGFQRVGIGKTWLHLDDDETKAQRVAWLY